MTLQSSQKCVYSSVTTAADRAEETPAEKAHTQSKASCYCSCIASVAELLMERLANVVYTALEFSVLVLLLAHCTPPSTTHSVSQQQLLCTASHSASPLLPPRGVHFPDPKTFEQQRAADQTWIQSAALCLQIHSAPLNQKQLPNINQKIYLLSLSMQKITIN